MSAQYDLASLLSPAQHAAMAAVRKFIEAQHEAEKKA